MPKPTVGRTVLVVGGPALSNGAEVAPGVITRVWSDGMVNVTILPDGSNQPRSATSVVLVNDEDTARGRTGVGMAVPVAFWPTIS